MQISTIQCNAMQCNVMQWATNNISWWIAVSSITDPVTICVNLLNFTRETRVPVIFSEFADFITCSSHNSDIVVSFSNAENGCLVSWIIWINKQAEIQDDRGYWYHFNFVYSNIPSIEISLMLLLCHRTNVSAPVYMASIPLKCVSLPCHNQPQGCSCCLRPIFNYMTYINELWSRIVDLWFLTPHSDTTCQQKQVVMQIHHYSETSNCK